MRGSAPERSCGQGVPRVDRTVQIRVVLDAIVSNKTFGNATSAPACFKQFSATDRKSTRLNSSHLVISYAVFCLKKKKKKKYSSHHHSNLHAPVAPAHPADASGVVAAAFTRNIRSLLYSR